ncbi:EF-hand domain-containing protein [Zavarzinella formosa]|uniref:EF-hand domain-containing protein n=1 Tax=Zavarzinella formosa TaxID=360055 RepID=UPI0002D4ED54|nr:EF-hand domain-containing protein [Zavarzinella formosa]
MKHLFTGAAILAAAGFSHAAEPAPRPAVPVEIVIVGEDKLTRIELQVEVDGKPLSSIWDETFSKLFTYHDRNGDGAMDAKEAARLPAATALRHGMGNGFVPPVGLAPEFAELDRDKDGKVTSAEVAAYYRSAGLGNVLIGVGRLPGGAELSAEILKRLDTDGDGKVSEKEWKAASETLKSLDKNDDELIGAGELVPKLTYPGAAGSLLLTPPAAGASPTEAVAKLPLVLLPTDVKDTAWAAEIARRNKKFAAASLPDWRQKEPALRQVIRLGGKAEKIERFALAGDRIRIMGWVAGGRLPEAGESARRQFANQFKNPSDEPEEGAPKGRRRAGEGLEWLTPIADRDGDGKLSQQELDAWLDLQEQIARGQAMISILDAHTGLFEILDTDHDGALSVRELRSAWERVREAGATDQAKMPRILVAVASQGYPKSLVITGKSGPPWFKAMDRNGDGDVSRREFTGTAADFQKIDTDGDGLISLVEAETFKLPAKK